MIDRLAHPYALLLLLLLPALLYVRLRRPAGSRLLRPGNLALATLKPSWAQRLSPLLSVLEALGLLLLIVALARPQDGLTQRNVQKDSVDIVLVLDLSTSMRAVDFSDEKSRRNRLDAVKEVAKTFIKGREMDRIGLIGFAAMPYSFSPLTLDHAWLEERLEGLKTGELPDGTAIGTAVVSGVNRLRESEAESKVLVLLTDGMNTAGEVSPQQALPLAQAEDIRIYSIGAGSEGPVLMPMIDPFGRERFREVTMRIDHATLSMLAEETGGQYFRARNPEQLEEVFQEIDELERTEIELTEYTLYEERFLPFALIGCFLLFVERLLASGRLGRVLA